MTTEAATPVAADNTQAGETTGAPAEGVKDEGSAAPVQQTDGAKPVEGETKPAGESKDEGASKVPETYEFTMPEGVELDTDAVNEFTAVAKKLGLSQEAAQELVSLEAKRVQQQAEAHVNLVKGWAEEVKADKALGGDKLAENLAIAKRAIDLGPPELKDLLNSTGMGNHPAVFKWAHAIGKALSEDNFVPGNKPTAPAKSLANVLYPDQT